ncbi:hypothetical protein BDC45DRAFT_561945 [Circinella umbellata]|nr:hypothetical protein BDC45DRAFT_561945 [Circinella umbellata]
MSFWTPSNELPSDKSQSDETPVVNRNYIADVEESSDHQALLLGFGAEDNEDNNDTLYLTTRAPQHQQQPEPAQQHGISSSDAPPRYHIPFETYSQDDKGLTRNIQVNAFSEELYSFLQQRNTVPPKIFVHIKGTSNQNEQYRRTYDSNGQQVTVEPVLVGKPGEYIPHVDFDYTINCSDLVSQISDGFHVLPERKTGYVKTVLELCEDYVRDTHRLKELQLTKVIDWDEALLSRLVTAGIHAHGYSHRLSITIEKREHKVTVKPASRISRMADNKFIRFFFYITFLFIFAWPMLILCRKKIGHVTLQSKWQMELSEKRWCDQYMTEILGQIPPAKCGLNVTVHQ